MLALSLVHNSPTHRCTAASSSSRVRTRARQGLPVGLRAESGGIASRLTFAQDRLASNQVGLENAYSRIMDVDLASEIVDYTKNSIQVYAASAMLVQANLNMSIVSDLLMSTMRK